MEDSGLVDGDDVQTGVGARAACERRVRCRKGSGGWWVAGERERVVMVSTTFPRRWAPYAGISAQKNPSEPPTHPLHTCSAVPPPPWQGPLPDSPPRSRWVKIDDQIEGPSASMESPPAYNNVQKQASIGLISNCWPRRQLSGTCSVLTGPAAAAFWCWQAPRSERAVRAGVARKLREDG